MRRYEVLENLIRVNRYAGNPLIKSESVSDHVWCMITLALEYLPIMHEKFNGISIPMNEVVYSIALHDLDEALTSDVPRLFKHHNKEIETAIANTVDSIMKNKLTEKVYNDVKKSDDKSTPIGFLVKIFDVAQAGFKMRSEILLGNKFFKIEIGNVTDTFEGMYEFLNSDKCKFHNNIKEAYSWLLNEFLDEFYTYKTSEELFKAREEFESH